MQVRVASYELRDCDEKLGTDFHVFGPCEGCTNYRIEKLPLGLSIRI